MKNIDITNSEVLQAIKERINNGIDTLIAENSVKKAIEKLNEASLFELSDIFGSVSGKLYTECANGKAIIGEYTTSLLENNDVRDGYILYRTLSNPPKSLNENNAERFVNEVVSSLSKKEAYYGNGINAVRECVKRAVSELALNAEDIDKILSEMKCVRENLDYLLKTKKTIKNIAETIEATQGIVDYVSDKIEEEKDSVDAATPEEVSNFADSLSEGKNGFLATLVENSLYGKDDVCIFEEYKNKCIGQMEEILSAEESTENKSRILSLKEGLEKKTFNKDTFSEDIVKLDELSRTLSNE